MNNKILFVGNDFELMVYTEDGNMKFRIGLKVFQPSLQQVFKLLYILDEYVTDTFEREAQDNV
nr:MAG TPA: hypothetical protein [Caudoviricetes sp.]